jgi:MoaA/NifB/PqqE/SkfB family radical SAM enzyme
MSDFQRTVAEHGFSLVWNLPVPYSSSNPINLELESAQLEAGGPGNRWLYVEPDGDVIPGQGMQPVLGNFLTDPFEKIWENARTANQ